jgi:hypothetical protein
MQKMIIKQFRCEASDNWEMEAGNLEFKETA